MLRPVELDAARNPWPGETHKRGLDHWLIVEHVVTVGLVLQDVNATADFRQHHCSDELVLDPDCLPLAVYGLFRDAIRKRQWIHLTTAALVNALLQEHRVLVRHSRH